MVKLADSSPQILLSLPRAVVAYKDIVKSGILQDCFVESDPIGLPLGSGGGTAHLLVKAWKETGEGLSFREWLQDSRKLIIHGGGQSRRLPAYAGIGKPLIPIPVIRHSYGQYIDQNWLDIQVPYYHKILSSAPDNTKVMITSGDVLLKFTEHLPIFPSADLIAFGMSVEAQQAQHFGVFFSSREEPDRLDFFLQKPDVEQINSLSSEYDFLIDTGMWLFSEKSIMLLMELCGWDEKSSSFQNDYPKTYEMYASFGLSLGRKPSLKHPKISELSSTVIDLPNPEFYHLGTSRQIIETFTLLQNQKSNASISWIKHPDQFIQNSIFENDARKETNHTLWIENSFIPSEWQLDCEHILTGVPENNWKLRIERGTCLDFVPIGEHDFCVRAYGIDDIFSGAIGADDTLWFGRLASTWFENRGIDINAINIDNCLDIQKAPIFPVISFADLDPMFIEWLIANNPKYNEKWMKLWIELPKISADDVRSKLNMARLLKQKSQYQTRALEQMYYKGDMSIFHRLDLKRTSKLWVDSGLDLPNSMNNSVNALINVHDHMFRSALFRGLGDDKWQQDETTAFSLLRDTLLSQAGIKPVDPKCCVLQDQIIWGRSPARLDLAGGWSDTPPYCLEHGGKVVNIAVNLNGQPPIQVFARWCDQPEIVIRSIDLGVGQRISTYEDLDSYAQPGSEFALAKAALAISGFLPRFNVNASYTSLEEQLKAFGGGIQLSLLAAIPQGSGLGTSSILTATLLGVLDELCGFNWDKHEIISRTMAVEQMLTTGGGWQDQSGAVFGGIKLFETSSGLLQKPVVRWLPDYLFGSGYANERILLYYTGITRLAKNILQEIVRGMFLNSRETLNIVHQIHNHAIFTFDAIQRNDYEELCDAVLTSWKLNQQLDSGTNPPEVQNILNMINSDLSAAKLLGAGGGGYLLILAKDAVAGDRIKRTLLNNPPNTKARFVDISLSQSGLEITRS